MIYSFKCECGNTRDVEQSIHAEIEEPMCTDCHESMTRIWSSPAITFKGVGFYTTDYKH
jgi:predicted nucleic acid-binding Zn ribbon protein